MVDYLLPIALIAYVVSVVLAALAIIYRSDAARGGASAVFVVAWLAHGGALLQRALDAGGFSLNNMGEYLLALGWAVMTLLLVLWFGWRVHVAGIILGPLVAITVFASFALLSGAPAEEGLPPDGWFLFHTAISTLGMATLCVALAMSLIYLFQDHALKSRRTLKLLERLPSLERCDRIGFHALVIGFVLLTLGIATGVIVNASLYHRMFVLGFKQTLPVLAWGVFATVLVARFKLGFRGRKSAYLTITGVTLGLLTVVGMTL